MTVEPHEEEPYADEGMTGRDELWSQSIDDAMRDDRWEMRSEVDRP